MIQALMMSASVLVGLGAAVLIGCRKSNRLRLTLLTLVVMLAVFCIRMPLYLEEDHMSVALVRSFAHALQAVTLSEDMEVPMEEGSRLITSAPEHMAADQAAQSADLVVDMYRLYSIVLSVIAPILGGALLLETLAAFFPYIRLKWPGYRSVFVFSRVNPQSVLLAQSIQQESRARIIFQYADGSDALVQQAKDTGAVCVSGEVSLRQISGLIRSVTYVFIDSDEQENIKDLASRLAAAPEKGWLRGKRRVRLYAFAQSREAEATIDLLAERYRDSANQIVCMLNVKENAAQHILEKYPLHHYGVTAPDGTKDLHVLVVGSDAQAEHFFANAYICGQMHDTRLTVTVTAPDAADFARRLYASAPMLRHPEDPAVRMCGDVRCIPMGDEVDDALLSQVHYILISMGSDAKNKEVASSICRAIDRQMLTQPGRAGQEVPILYMQEDDALNALYTEKIEPNPMPQGRGCEMIPVGGRREQYSAQVLFCEERVFRGFFVHLAYMKDTQPQSDEVLLGKFIKLMNEAGNRRSSVACAMQMDYRRHVLEGPMSAAQAEAALAQAEHRRWTAYTILNGYRAPDPQELQAYAWKPGFKHKRDDLLLHPCLVESRCTLGGELWRDRKPADALDELSLQLHEMVTGELEALLGKETMMPARQRKTRAEVKTWKKQLIDHLNVPPSELGRAQMLIENIFRDYKQLDRDIVHQTDWIVTSARKYAPLLRSFWK